MSQLQTTGAGGCSVHLGSASAQPAVLALGLQSVVGCYDSWIQLQDMGT